MPHQLALDISPTQKLEFVTSPPKILTTRSQSKKRFHSTASLPEKDRNRYSLGMMQQAQQSETDYLTESQYSTYRESGDCISLPLKTVPGCLSTDSSSGTSYTSSSFTSCVIEPEKTTSHSQESIHSSGVDPPWYISPLLNRYVNSVADKYDLSIDSSASSSLCSCSSTTNNNTTIGNTRSSRLDTYISSPNKSVAAMNRSRSNSRSRPNKSPYLSSRANRQNRSRSKSRSCPFPTVSMSSSIASKRYSEDLLTGSKRNRHKVWNKHRNTSKVDKMIITSEDSVDKVSSCLSINSDGSKRRREDIKIRNSSKHKNNTKAMADNDSMSITKRRHHRSAPSSTDCGRCKMYCFKCKCPKRQQVS